MVASLRAWASYVALSVQVRGSSTASGTPGRSGHLDAKIGSIRVAIGQVVQRRRDHGPAWVIAIRRPTP
jgi:hypothetical protein